MKEYKIRNETKSLLVINLDTFTGSKRKALYLPSRLVSRKFSDPLPKEDFDSREIQKLLYYKQIMSIEIDINIPDKVIIAPKEDILEEQLESKEISSDSKKKSVFKKKKKNNSLRR